MCNPYHTISPFRRCTKCGVVFPATPEFFPLDKRHQKVYLNSRCRACNKAYFKERHQKPKIKAYYKSYRQQTEIKKRKKIQGASPEYKAKAKARRCTPEGRAKSRKFFQKTEYKERQKAWRITPSGRASEAATRQRYRAKKHALARLFTSQNWQCALDYFSINSIHCCAICRRPVGLWRTLAMDHWIPISDIKNCPGTVPWNIIPLCHGIDGCNNSKSNRNALDWLTEELGPRKAKKKLAEIQAYFDQVRKTDDAP